jgi:acyl carrier protein
MNKEYNEIKIAIRKLLADFLGIEPDDVEDDFSLTEELHMKATDLTDFMEILSTKGFDTESLDFTEIETFSDLIDELTQHQ